MIVWNHRPLPDSTPKPWMERLFNQCAFPFDDADVTLSCCLPVVPEKVYCREHCRVVFVQGGR